MNELKSQLPKSVVLIIILGIFSITVSGYVLFFQSQKRILSKDREYELLKEKQMHAQENYSDLQKKYDSTAEQLKIITKDYDTTSQKQQECKEKHEELQIKYDDLLKSKEKISQKLESVIEHPGSTQPSTPEKEKDNKTSASPPIESDTAKPLTPAPLSYHCPSSEIVSKNFLHGSWSDNQLTWFVDYVSRPLNDNEAIKQLFKILYDGQTIACYYELGISGEEASIVIKGGTKNNKISLTAKDGWTACSNQDCESVCSNDSLTRCHFTLRD